MLFSATFPGPFKHPTLLHPPSCNRLLPWAPCSPGFSHFLASLPSIIYWLLFPYLCSRCYRGPRAPPHLTHLPGTPSHVPRWSHTGSLIPSHIPRFFHLLEPSHILFSLPVMLSSHRITQSCLSDIPCVGFSLEVSTPFCSLTITMIFFMCSIGILTI